MAGHSKWANIKHRKARQDAAKGKIWSKCSRAIIVAAKSGGGDCFPGATRGCCAWRWTFPCSGRWTTGWPALSAAADPRPYPAFPGNRSAS